MKRYDTSVIRTAVSLEEVLARYGVEPNRHGFARCPFHEERTASFKVYENGTFHCFGCGAHGDVIDFVRRAEGLTFGQACEMLGGTASYSLLRRAEAHKRRYENKSRQREQAEAEYWAAFDEWRINEIILKVLCPDSPGQEPEPLWLAALSVREMLSQRLDRAEMMRRKP